MKTYLPILLLCLASCTGETTSHTHTSSPPAQIADHTPKQSVKKQLHHFVQLNNSKTNLTIYEIDYQNIDLTFGTMPSKNDQRVIFCAGASFTGELLDEFKHFNIAGDHVSSGVRHKGYKCRYNTGCFTYYKDQGQFFYKDYTDQLDLAAKHGGMAFGQEMLIHQSKEVPYHFKKTSINHYRALCLLEGKIRVIDSQGALAIGDFVQALIHAGVQEALYMDMGRGWNYSWYRNQAGTAVEIHKIKNKYATNWITFYSE